MIACSHSGAGLPPRLDGSLGISLAPQRFFDVDAVRLSSDF